MQVHLSGPLLFLTFVLLATGAGLLYLMRRWQTPEVERPDVWEMSVVPPEPHVDAAPSANSPEEPATDHTVTLQRVTSQGGEEYMLLHSIGAGAAGTIFEAVHVRGSMERVAVKILTQTGWDNAESWTRFTREVDVCRSFQHPAIVRVFDWGVWQDPDTMDPKPFMIMELVSGQSLRSIMDSRPGQPVEWATVVLWLLETLEALKVAHDAGVVHRDVKPDNLMVTDEGTIKVMDFGLARQGASSELTQTNTHLGTPRYMSPEHFNARSVTPQSDLYSVGVVAYELLAGRAPYLDKDLWTLVAHVVAGDAPDIRQFNPLLPDELVSVVNNLMAPKAENRYPDAASALDALTAIALHHNLMFAESTGYTQKRSIRWADSSPDRN